MNTYTIPAQRTRVTLPEPVDITPIEALALMPLRQAWEVLHPEAAAEFAALLKASE